nr:hypothetical protein JVH1_0722 [Rhodococcus sp. JVH1]
MVNPRSVAADRPSRPGRTTLARRPGAFRSAGTELPPCQPHPVLMNDRQQRAQIADILGRRTV